jgi:predicted small lipoprotein YifL
MRVQSQLAAAAAVAASLILAGCGQKGPLYLPEKGGTVVTTPAQGPPPSPVTSGQPAEPAPAPQPQSTAEPAPADMPAPPKKDEKDKTNKDEDQQNPQ